LKHGEKVNQIKIWYSKEGDRVKLFYEDDGAGVSEANKSKLFESGFTTGKGTGLGLYLVKKMMDVYGWQIQENGEPGKGIKIVMTIPEYSTNGTKNYFFSN
jgi:signal transduction histidine kinase